MPSSSKKKSRKSEITSNMEDYLETIYEIGERQGEEEVRVTDVARKLKVTRPSVVGMIKHLCEHDLVDHTRYGRFKLTGEGREVAIEMANRHRVLKRFLEEVLMLTPEVAEADACRMEHTLSEPTIDRFIEFEHFRESKGGSLPSSASFRRFILDKPKK